MDRDRDFDSLAGFFAPNAVWDLSESHLGIYEGGGPRRVGDVDAGENRRCPLDTDRVPEWIALNRADSR
jgi:hypothetical protein